MTPKTNDTFIEEKMREFERFCANLPMDIRTYESLITKEKLIEWKSLLRLALEEQREDFNKKVEGMLEANEQRKIESPMTNSGNMEWRMMGYSDALEDILSLLSDNKTK